MLSPRPSPPPRPDLNSSMSLRALDETIEQQRREIASLQNDLLTAAGRQLQAIHIEEEDSSSSPLFLDIGTISSDGQDDGLQHLLLPLLNSSQDDNEYDQVDSWADEEMVNNSIKDEEQPSMDPSNLQGQEDQPLSKPNSPSPDYQESTNLQESLVVLESDSAFEIVNQNPQRLYPRKGPEHCFPKSLPPPRFNAALTRDTLAYSRLRRPEQPTKSQSHAPPQRAVEESQESSLHTIFSPLCCCASVGLYETYIVPQGSFEQLESF